MACIQKAPITRCWRSCPVLIGVALVTRRLDFTSRAATFAPHGLRGRGRGSTSGGRIAGPRRSRARTLIHVAIAPTAAEGETPFSYVVPLATQMRYCAAGVSGGRVGGGGISTTATVGLKLGSRTAI